MSRRRVLVDFDGTITRRRLPWHGYAVCEDKPIPGVLAWLHRILQLYDVSIVSGRAKYWAGRWCIRNWLKKYGGVLWHDTEISRGLRHIEITCKKVDRYIMYIGDREWNFDGIHYPSPEEIENFVPWYEKGRSNG